MTNGDKWRAMTDEEIAEKLSSNCTACPVFKDCRVTGFESRNSRGKAKTTLSCVDTILDWLKQPAGKDEKK